MQVYKRVPTLATCKEVQDSLGFCIPGAGFRILSVNLGFWIPGSLNCNQDSKTQGSTSKTFPDSRIWILLTWGETSQCSRSKGLLMGRRRLQAGGWCGEGIGVLQETGKAADRLMSFKFVEASISSWLHNKSRLTPKKLLKWNDLVFHWCFYNKKNITWPLGDTKFLFSCWKNMSLVRTLEGKFRISARPCNILYLCNSNLYTNTSVMRTHGFFLFHPRTDRGTYGVHICY